jgi:hypothetical protein
MHGQVSPSAVRLPNSEAPTWKAIHACTLATVAEMIAKAEQGVVTFTHVTRKPVELPLPERPLILNTDVKAPAGGWRDQDFFLIDSYTKDASKPRWARVETKYPPKAQRLVLDITPSVRRALGTATHVYVGYPDNLELYLLRQLQAQLKESASRGPRVEDLWTVSQDFGTTQLADGFNEGQSEALTAMLQGGGWLLWGPPGTGKTKVIVHAVAAALDRGWSVLIASHTHVAVDNVVRDVAKTVDTAGVLVRIGNDEKVDPQVAAHEWLLLDKAAAVITRLHARQEALDKAQQTNSNDPNRQRLVDINERLTDVDVAGFGSARRAYQAQMQADLLQSEMAAREGTVNNLRVETLSLGERTESSRRDAAPLASLQERQRGAHESAHKANLQLEGVRRELQKWQIDLASAVESMAQVERRHRRWSSRLPWTQVAVQTDLNQCRERVQALERAILGVNAMATDLTDAIRRHTTAEQQLDPQVRQAMRARVDLEQRSTAYQKIRSRLDEQEQQLADAKSDLIEARTLAASVTEPAGVIAAMEAAGVPQLLADREALNEHVSGLDAEWDRLKTAKAQLADECRDTKRELLEAAPVIACTLSSLTTKPELANRRFDMVIIDEAASAKIPQLVYAGSKADRSLAYVGDFLQNEPIVDVADAITEEQRQLKPWMGEIFGLLGIRDRATATAHPRCIVLRVQYRYPSTIADIVNDFCYDGLLESARHATAEDGTIVTFIDTSDHRRQALQKFGTSWVNPLGLDLMQTITEQQDPAQSIGLVTPYKAHADQAGQQARRQRLPIECGTAHSFQGRQFHTVILDLMQDANQRGWASQADLKGNARAVAAAKLLNVGITRAQHHLYLVGDWPFIRRTPTPGMQAIADLANNPHFEIVHAAQILENEGPWAAR